MTFVLAIVGAVTAVVATALSVFALLRDRPRVVVRSALSNSSERGEEIAVLVANHGRQPVTILDATRSLLLAAHVVSPRCPLGFRRWFDWIEIADGSRSVLLSVASVHA
jgi:hypothetical protein